MIGPKLKLPYLKALLVRKHDKVLSKEITDHKPHKRKILSNIDDVEFPYVGENSFLLTSEKSINQTNDSRHLKHDWRTSNISIKLISGFLMICVLTIMVGYLGLIATHQVEYLYNLGLGYTTFGAIVQGESELGIKESISHIQLGILTGVGLTIVSAVGIAIWMLDSIKKTLQLERKSLITEFQIKNARLVAMSELAARLGHDLRNPLQVIKGTLDVMKPYSKIDEITAKRIARISTAVLSMTRLIDHMLNFVNTFNLEISSNSISQIIKSAILKVANPENIQIDYPNTDLKVNCDFRLIEIVFANLISNAVNAIKGKGKITIGIIERKTEVLMEFIDTGPGISRTEALKLSDPLFTTKVYGTGFGLASCVSILEQHNGKIFMKNNPTTFTVILPKQQIDSTKVKCEIL